MLPIDVRSGGRLIDGNNGLGGPISENPGALGKIDGNDMGLPMDGRSVRRLIGGVGGIGFANAEGILGKKVVCGVGNILLIVGGLISGTGLGGLIPVRPGNSGAF